MSDRSKPQRIELASGYSIPRLLNGLWQLAEGHSLSRRDRATDLGLLLEAFELGYTTFDCADIYLGVEELLGRLRATLAERGVADRLQVHTKYVPDRDALANLSRTAVEAAIDRSLARLGVERLDLVQFHWWEFAVPGHVETAVWLDELRRAGKIHHLGVTNYDAGRLELLLDAGVRVTSNQVQLSVLDRRPLGSMSELCQRRGIGLICYGALAGGLLTERYLDSERPRPPFENRSLPKYDLIVDEFGGWPAHQELLSALARIADAHDATAADVAVRWVLDQPAVAAVVLGTRSACHLASRARAEKLELQEAERRELADLVAGRGPGGEIYGLERVRNGPHARIMKTSLNRARQPWEPAAE